MQNKNLTREVFQRAYENPNTDVRGTLQVLSFGFGNDDENRGKLFATLSNGIHQTNVLVNYNCEQRFRNAVGPMDIIEVDLRLIQERDFEQLCLQSFVLKEDDVPGQVGRPTEFIPHVRDEPQRMNNQLPDPRANLLQANANRQPAVQNGNLDQLNRRLQDAINRHAVRLGELRLRVVNGNEPRQVPNGAREVPQVPQQRQPEQRHLQPVNVPADLALRRDVPLAAIEIPRPEVLVRENRNDINIRQNIQPREIPRANPRVQVQREEDVTLGRRAQQEDADDNFNRIADLVDNDKSWILKAKVNYKSDLSQLANGRGDSFRISIKDSTGSINCKFFYQAASQFYNLIEVGRVYEFQGGVVHVASLQSRVRSPYEIVFTGQPIITPVEGAADGQCQNAMISISEIHNEPEFAEVNLMALVKSPGNLRILNLRNGIQRAHLSVTLVDSSEREIRVCFWGDIAERINLDQGEIYLFENLLVKTYNDSKFVEWQSSSKLFFDEFDSLIYKDLLDWKDNHFQNYLQKNNSIEVPFISQDSRPRPFVTLSELKQQAQEYLRQPENQNSSLLLDTTAFINNVSWKTWYKACRRCMRSLFEEQGGYYFCRVCQSLTMEHLIRFKAEIQIVDGTSWITATVFGEANCAILFQKTSIELEAMERTNREAYRRLLRSKDNTEIALTISAKINTFGGRENIGYTIISCLSTDAAAQQLIPRIRERLAAHA